MTTLKSEATASLPNNTSGEISPTDVRTTILDLMDTVTPGYASNQVVTPAAVAVTTTPSDFTAWDTTRIDTEEFSTNLTTGIVTMNGDFTIDFSASFTVEFGTNVDLLIESVFSGDAVKYTSTRSGGGVGKPGSMSLSGIYVATPGSTIKIQVSTDTNETVTFSDCIWTIKLVPLINDP